MFSFFSDKGVTEFARALAQNIAQKYPVHVANDSSRTVAPNRIAALLEQEMERVKLFVLEQKLGPFQKAKLANQFRWELKDLGYQPDLVELLTEASIVYATVKTNN